MQTLTTDYIVKGFKNFDVRPVRNAFFRNSTPGTNNNQKCTCGLATLYLIENVNPQELDIWWTSSQREVDIVQHFERKGYSEKYLTGFMTGFDGVIYSEERLEDADFAIGFSDGQNVWLEANKFWEEKEHANSSN